MKFYVCEDCGRSFASGPALGGHRRIHTQNTTQKVRRKKFDMTSTEIDHLLQTKLLTTIQNIKEESLTTIAKVLNSQLTKPVVDYRIKIHVQILKKKHVNIDDIPSIDNTESIDDTYPISSDEFFSE